MAHFVFVLLPTKVRLKQIVNVLIAHARALVSYLDYDVDLFLLLNTVDMNPKRVIQIRKVDRILNQIDENLLSSQFVDLKRLLVFIQRVTNDSLYIEPLHLELEQVKRWLHNVISQIVQL